MLRGLGAEICAFGLDEVEDALKWRPERIVVAGGDGSVGPAAEAAARVEVPLAVVPVGTANDFARALELPLDPAEACRLAVQGEKTRRLELAWMGERAFVNAASVGLSPVAARKAQGLKRVLGALAYPVGALRAGLTAQPVACRVTCDDTPIFDGSAWQVSVAVTGAFGGGSRVAGDPSDGQLDVVVIEAGSRARLALHAYGLRASKVESQPGVNSRRGRTVEIHTDGQSGFNVDGEQVDAESATFRVERDAFALVHG